MPYEKIVTALRRFRVWHRYVGLALSAFVLVSAITGILLALKKDVAVLQPPTQKGSAEALADWLPLHELTDRAHAAFLTEHPEYTTKSNGVDRVDVRPSKGTAKVLLEKGYWEVQIDGRTGDILSIARRHSDWIEQLHDGSIISDGFKLISMNVLGWGLLMMLATGLWLYFGPKRVRELRRGS